MKYKVFADHETIIYEVEAKSKSEAEDKVILLNGQRKKVDLVSVEAEVLEE